MSTAFHGQIGDYVLGMLDGAELTAFEAELDRDPALAQQVAALRNRMQALDDTVTPARIPSDLWKRIEARLEPRVVPRSASWAQMRQQSWLLAASIVIAAGIGFVAGQQFGRPTQPVVIAVLVSDDAIPGAIVEAFANNSVHIVPLEVFEVPAGKVLEVWTKPNEEIGAVSLGRFARSQEIVLDGATLPLPQAGQLYEITLEDAPGSPTGKPTGPILAKGLARSPI
ncbi:anti-sigma factor [Devosia sp. A16]|uniref:anti-sigma factor n=1 Tax=Devosia sp. A16 TaxID=1736675 RepID=UPI0006D7A31F|nr:anti-sigma factor [Devosia sp. A16]